MNSQLRQDIVSGDWIAVAPGRAKAHLQALKKRSKRKVSSARTCPFEDLQKSGHGKPILIYQNSHDWKLQIIQNKYPAFTHENKCVSVNNQGPYAVTDAAGHHDLIVTRSHTRNFAQLNPLEAAQVFQAFRERYQMFLSDQCLAYASFFHNWGPTAGASMYHPHYQIIATPIIPPDVMHSLQGSLKYFQAHSKCVHCVMLEWELAQKKRILYEDDTVVAYAPFVSKNPFEIRIYPKAHAPYFEETSDTVLSRAAAALQYTLQRYAKKLRDPDYNFFVHTAPIQDKGTYSMYHWHIEVIPKITTDAGFELGTGIEINVIDPDQAIEILK